MSATMRQSVRGEDLRYRVVAWIDQQVDFQPEPVSSIADIRDVPTEDEVKDLTQWFEKCGYRVTVDDLSIDPSDDNPAPSFKEDDK